MKCLPLAVTSLFCEVRLGQVLFELRRRAPDADAGYLAPRVRRQSHPVQRRTPGICVSVQSAARALFSYVVLSTFTQLLTSRGLQEWRRHCSTL